MGIRIRSNNNISTKNPAADTSAPQTEDGKVAISAISGRKPKIIYTVGIPGCGKSTWTKEYISNHPEAKRINKDEIRIEKFSGQKWSKQMENDVNQIKRYRIIRSIIDGYDAVVDDTNLNPGHHRDYQKIADRFGVELEMKVFDVPLKQALRQDKQRTESVGEEVIRKRHREFEKIKSKLPTLPAPSEDIKEY